ncbi:unnamed protein product, partial [marine sediment metagenome]
MILYIKECAIKILITGELKLSEFYYSFFFQKNHEPFLMSKQNPGVAQDTIN